MNIIKKLFEGLNLTWLKLIALAVVVGLYTGLITYIPALEGTSFQDVLYHYEWWIFFGIIIIMNSKSALDSSLKCFVFYLISLFIGGLIADLSKFSVVGWSSLGNYWEWVFPLLSAFSIGFVGFYMRKDKWWGLIILFPMLIILGYHYSKYLNSLIYVFPYHLLSCIFCLVTIFLYALIIFKDKKIKTAAIIISSTIAIFMTVISLTSPPKYGIW